VPLGKAYENQDCAIARALELIGERWTLLIVRDAFHGLSRYDEFQRSLGIATNVLSSRLRALLDAGVFERPDGPRGGYRLTQKGRDLFPVVLTIMQWGETYEQGADGKEVIVMHAPCEHEAGAQLSCEHCGEPLAAHDLRIEPGPASSSTLTPPQLAAWGPKTS
jgi:DNA-binding HxlR family transcriptional regulator